MSIVGHVNKYFRGGHVGMFPTLASHVNDLYEFLEKRKGKFKNWNGLAEMTGLTYSGLVRGIKAGTLSVENCLTVAEALGEDPAAVLRAAAKDETADQLERLYGKVGQVLSAELRRFLDQWERLPESRRDLVRALFADFRRTNPSPNEGSDDWNYAKAQVERDQKRVRKGG